MQAHGSDGMVEEENCVFFLPHKPRSEIIESPLFLFMKGTGIISPNKYHLIRFFTSLLRCNLVINEICLCSFFSGWCGGGADHYEPLIANASPMISHEKVALVL